MSRLFVSEYKNNIKLKENEKKSKQQNVAYISRVNFSYAPNLTKSQNKKGGLLHFGVKSPLLEIYSFSIILFNNV